MKLIAPIAAVLLALLSSNAFAISGNELHAWCTNYRPENANKFGIPGAYIIGVFKYNRDLKNTGVLEDAICYPDRISTGQLADITCKYQKENPANRTDAAPSLIVRSLEAAFLCK